MSAHAHATHTETVAKSGRAVRVTLSDADAAALHTYLLTDAALNLLRSVMRRGPLAGRSPHVVSLINPLLPLLVRLAD
jgi:hypothetical protein